MIGQIHQSSKLETTHLNYLLIPAENDPGNLIFLLEGLIKHAGKWGAKQLVAEIPLDSELLTHFRKASFSLLAKQQIYRWDGANDARNAPLGGSWRVWNCEDVPNMQNLYLTLVPPLIQPIEPLTRRERLGLVYLDKQGAVQAYADLVYGPAGAWVLPVIPPKIQADIADLLHQLIANLPERNGRPVYIASRSYQPWIDQALEHLPVSAGPEQALVVRYLALRQKTKESYAFPSIENGKTEPTIPLAPIKSQQD